MNRNIEVGCLVMVVKSKFCENIGKTAVVMEHGPQDFYGKVWGLSGEISGDFPMSLNPYIWASTDQLIRIDNHDTSADEVEADMEVVK